MDSNSVVLILCLLYVLIEPYGMDDISTCIRLPGMDATPDSHAMLDAVTGNDLQIGFEDILNRSEFRTTEDSFRSVQHKMEAKFGLSS